MTADAVIEAHLTHLRVQRRLAERTLAMYADAFARMGALMAPATSLTEVKPHHVRSWVGRLHAQ